MSNDNRIKPFITKLILHWADHGLIMARIDNGEAVSYAWTNYGIECTSEDARIVLLHIAQGIPAPSYVHGLLQRSGFFADGTCIPGYFHEFEPKAKANG